MEIKTVIEVRDRTGKLVQRVPVVELPVTVGRSLDQQIILDDPYVSPQHLTIASESEGGELVVFDSGSVNGMLIGTKKIERIPVSHSLVLHVGQSTLTFLDPAKPVVEALRLSSEFTRNRLFHPFWALLSLFILLVVGSWLTFIFEYQPPPYDKLPAVAAYFSASTLGIILVWLTLWSILSFILTHRSNFFSHMVIAVLIVGVISLGGYIVVTAAYLLDSSFLLSYSRPLLSFSLLGLALFYHLRLATFLSPQRAARRAAAVIVMAAIIMASVQYAKQTGFRPYVNVEETLRPPFFGFVRSSTAAEFIQELGTAIDQGNNSDS